ncbi:MAG: hypothetical protein JXB15_05440 [Anaerolineales bacterium]|nr:hypothetical protein [Anaerolineales bacterium]
MMADITAVFGVLLFLGLSYPALLLFWQLLYPGATERARLRLQTSAKACFGLGLALLLITLLPAVFFLSLPAGAAKLIGWVLIGLILAFSSLGAAGLSSRIGAALNDKMGGRLSEAGAFLRGALTLELASALPLLGWLLILPLATVTTLGAAAFAILRWMPAPARLAAQPVDAGLEPGAAS